MRRAMLLAAGVAAFLCGCGQNPPAPPNPAPSNPPRPAGAPAEKKDASAEAQKRQAEAALFADLGDVYLKHQKFQEAAKSFSQAIEVTKGISENAVYHLGLSAAQRNLGNPQEAVKNLEAAVEIFKKIYEQAKDDQKEFYIKQICLVYRELGRRNDAISWAEKISGEGKETGELTSLARLYAYIGENALAIDTYKAALKKAAPDADVLALQLEYADYLAQNKYIPEARKLAEEVLARTQDKQLALGAKRLLVRIYDTLGILDKVDFTAPPPTEENKVEPPKEGEEKKGEPPK
jgi:tetratricopeptide (TPR) repeat protein